MIEAHRVRKKVAHDPLDHLVDGPAFVGRGLQQLLFEDLPELALPRVLSGKALDARHHEIERLGVFA